MNGFQDERVQNGTYTYRYNLMGVYTVRSGPLRGLRLGSGAQVYGPRVIGNEIDRPYDYVYSKSYYLVSGSLGYSVKLPRARLDLQLNVDNLFRQEDLLPFSATAPGNVVRYMLPRVRNTWALRATYAF